MHLGLNADAIAALECSLSAERLSRYATAPNTPMAQALDKYIYNIALSESFYTSLHGIEVTLRNALHRELCNNFGELWFEVRGFLRHTQSKIICDLMNELSRKNKQITPGRVVAGLSFGFWVGLLGKDYDDVLWRPALHRAFPHRPPRYGRKKVHNKINRIRLLRNRVAHHEPILDRNLEEDHRFILEIIRWSCPVTADWVAHHSRFYNVYGCKESHRLVDMEDEIPF